MRIRRSEHLSPQKTTTLDQVSSGPRIEINFNKAEQLFKTSEKLTTEELNRVEFKNNNDDYSNKKSIFTERGNHKYTCHPITIELEGTNIQAQIIKQGGFDDGRKGKLKNEDVGLGVGVSKFVQTAVLVYKDPKSGEEVGKRIALSTIEYNKEAESEKRIESIIKENKELESVCSQQKFFEAKGKVHGNNNLASKSDTKKIKTIGISVIQTDIKAIITNNTKSLGNKEKKHLSKEMLKFLKKFTDSGFVHRDIKPENLAIVTVGGTKTIRSFDNGSICKAESSSQKYGTRLYKSFQALKASRIKDELSVQDQQSQDAFATAHTIYNICTGG